MINEQGNLSINSENIFPIIKKWLYSDHDIFYRELISNGCDAITKLKKLSLMGEFTPADDEKYFIRVETDPEEKTIKITDNGIGMTADEVKKYINDIAFSGAADFLEKYKDKANEDQIIGHFGLGFYSAFMVAHKVTIDTLSYKEGAESVHWESNEGTSFEMSASDKTDRGTVVTLYLGEDSYEFANEYRAKEVLEKYCSFMPVPIFFGKGELSFDEEKPEEEKSEAEGETAEGEETAKEEKKEEKKDDRLKPFNDTAPLWTKHPNDCTDEEYKDFYTKVFHDFREPLFWIHLNMDYPFNLKGILYFPKVNIEYETIEGKIKLYSNQVFIADNIKEVIPEFLLLLKGVIDCPDLPLNVSRSALQNDGFVKKISDYITKKVADKLTGMFNVDRENYEKYWDDIAPFIKFGCLKDDKFFEKMKGAFVYKNLDGKYLTLEEYLKERKTDEVADETEKTDSANDASKAETSGEPAEKAEKSDAEATDDAAKADGGDSKEEKKKDPEIIYYVTDEKQQSQYINMFRDEGIDAVVLNTNIDNPFISLLESKNEDIRFQRIDADLTGSFKEETDEEQLKADTEKLSALFKKVLGKEKLEVKAERLKNEKISSVITLAEDSRRMSDMMKMYSMNMPGGNEDLFAEQETLTLNVGNDLVKYILENEEGENCDLICRQLYDLAMLAHKPLAPEEMTKFVERSNEIMLMLTK